jgi:hypothetical protein
VSAVGLGTGKLILAGEVHVGGSDGRGFGRAVVWSLVFPLAQGTRRKGRRGSRVEACMKVAGEGRKRKETEGKGRETGGENEME